MAIGRLRFYKVVDGYEVRRESAAKFTHSMVTYLSQEQIPSCWPTLGRVLLIVVSLQIAAGFLVEAALFSSLVDAVRMLTSINTGQQNLQGSKLLLLAVRSSFLCTKTVTRLLDMNRGMYALR